MGVCEAWSQVALRCDGPTCKAWLTGWMPSLEDAMHHADAGGAVIRESPHVPGALTMYCAKCAEEKTWLRLWPVPAQLKDKEAT